MNINNLLQNLFDLFLSNMEINFQLQSILRGTAVYKSQILRNNLIENQKTKCCLDKSGYFCSVSHSCLTVYINILMKCNLSILIRKQCLIHASVMISEQIHWLT